MSYISTDRVTVLLVCPSGLEQKTLFTAINAVPKATVIARVSDMDSAVRITQMRKPDLLVASAQLIAEETAPLLGRAKELHGALIRVVIASSSTQKQRWLEANADFVLDDSNLNRDFPRIVRRVQADIDARLTL